MRFVLAIVLFVAAIASAGYGIAQRTVLAGPASYTATTTASRAAPVAVIDGSSLQALPGKQFVTATGSGPVFMAYGRTADVRGWVANAEVNIFRVDGSRRLVTSHQGTSAQIPSPRDSDLWLDQRSASRSLDWPLDLPVGYSLLIASDGTNAAPATVSIRWPLERSTPYAGPLIVAGFALLVLGLLVFVWALVHARRRHGPRRRQPRLPRPPRPRSISPRQQRAITLGPVRGRRRGFVALPVLIGGTLLLTGCTSGDLGTVLGQPTPSPTATATDAASAAGLEPVAVSRAQLKLILGRVASTVQAADTSLNAAQAAGRLGGPALAERTANYAIRTADGAQPAERAIPTGDIVLMLPQQNSGWPRTVFAVVADSTNAKLAPVSLMLTQDTPRSAYKADYVMPLEPNVQTPALAPADVGAVLVPPTVSYLATAPDKLASEYYDVLNAGPASAYATLFDTAADQLYASNGPAYRADRKAQVPSSAGLTFSRGDGTGTTVVFSTNDTGAIVAVDLHDIETVAPTQAGSAVNPTGQVRLLSGVTQTQKGIVSTYGIQLLFYVPPSQKSSQKIRVLGYSSGLLSAKELP